MAVDLLLHPAVGLLAIALLLSAFAAKTGPRTFYRLHYALGLSALGAAAAATVLGFATFYAATEEGIQFEETLSFHLIAAIVLLLGLVVQARLGLAMWRRRLHGPLLPRHRALARILLLLAGVVLALGGITLLTVH